MNYEELETFLAAAEQGNITKAAASLFIGQGTASLRIQRLEEALCVSLFYRRKGIREIRLTPEGEAFLPLARQWLSLWQKARQLQDIGRFQNLSLAAPESLHLLFSGFYQAFIPAHPDIVLRLSTEHSTQVHELLENQTADLGFVTNLHPFPNVAATPFFSEGTVCLFHDGCAFSQTGNFEDLREEDEIFCPISGSYQLWHASFFPGHRRTRVTTGSTSMLPAFLADESTWTIVPETTARWLKNRLPALRSSALPFAPPLRTIYILLNRRLQPWMKAPVRQFITEAAAFCGQMENMQLYDKQLEDLLSGLGQNSGQPVPGSSRASS